MSEPKPTMRLWDGDMDQVNVILAKHGIADAIVEVMRSRGLLLDVALKVAAAKDVPEWLRDEVRVALRDSPIRAK